METTEKIIAFNLFVTLAMQMCFYFYMIFIVYSLNKRILSLGCGWASGGPLQFSRKSTSQKCVDFNNFLSEFSGLIFCIIDFLEKYRGWGKIKQILYIMGIVVIF